MFVVVICYGHRPELNWFWLIPVMIVQYALILVCSLLGALCVSFVGDIRMVINMGMMFLLFTSGIFWDINTLANPVARELITTYNPIAFLIDAYRQVLMNRSLYDLQHLAVLGCVVLIALFIMHGVLHKASKIIASKVMNS